MAARFTTRYDIGMDYGLRDCLLVAAGGTLGALARYGVGIAAGKLLGKGFPWGTLIVNILGCFVMGLVVQWMLDASSAGAAPPASRHQLAFWHRGVAIGFLGGLTTFSSFAADTLVEFTAGQALLAIANVITNVAFSLAAAWAGMALMRAID